MIVQEALSAWERDNATKRVADNEVGDTVADALSQLRKARYVAVMVAHGFRGKSSFCSVSKAHARRWLTSYGTKPDQALYSILVHYEFASHLFLGSHYDNTPRESSR